MGAGGGGGGGGGGLVNLITWTATNDHPSNGIENIRLNHCAMKCVSQ